MVNLNQWWTEVVACIKRTLDWFGHVIGMDQTGVAKKISESKPECKKAQSEMGGWDWEWSMRAENTKMEAKGK
jgi:hypothetical protein